MRMPWQRKKLKPCPCGREHVRTKTGVLISLDNEPGSDPQLTAELKRVIEDPNATEEQERAALKRYLMGSP